MENFIGISLDGLFYAAWVFTVSLGLTLIYGVMRILNIAHGSFYALGAYAAASSLNFYFTGEWPPGLKHLAEKVELYFDAASLSQQFRYISLLLLAIILIYLFTKLIASRYYLRTLKTLLVFLVAVGYISLTLRVLWPLLIQDTTFLTLPLFEQVQNTLVTVILSYTYPIAICLLALILIVILLRFATNLKVFKALLVLLLTLGLTAISGFFLLPFMPEVFSWQLPLTEVIIQLPYVCIGVFVIVLIISPLLTTEIKTRGIRFLTGLLVALGTAYTINTLLPLLLDLPLTLLSKVSYLIIVVSLILSIACALLALINALRFVIFSFTKTKNKLYTHLLDAYLFLLAAGFYLSGRFPEASSYLILFIAALTIGIVFGILVERGALRFMHQHNEVVMLLVTYAIFLILEDLIKLTWGVESYPAYQLYNLLGSTTIYGETYVNYEFLRVAIALLSGVIVWWGLTKTRQGKQLVAVIHDREMSQAFGINVRGIFTFTFVVGAFLAALAGAFTVPLEPASLDIGSKVIVLAFAVAVIGGLGSIQGAFIGALMVGLARAAAVHYYPQAESFVIYGIMALVLIVRPRGLFALREGRKI